MIDWISTCSKSPWTVMVPPCSYYAVSLPGQSWCLPVAIMCLYMTYNTTCSLTGRGMHYTFRYSWMCSVSVAGWLFVYACLYVCTSTDHPVSVRLTWWMGPLWGCAWWDLTREGAGIWRGEVPREGKDCQVEASTGGWVSSKLTCAVLCSAYTVAVCAYNRIQGTHTHCLPCNDNKWMNLMWYLKSEICIVI